MCWKFKIRHESKAHYAVLEKVIISADADRFFWCCYFFVKMLIVNLPCLFLLEISQWRIQKTHWVGNFFSKMFFLKNVSLDFQDRFL